VSATAQEELSPYEQFNIEVPGDTFPVDMLSPRAAAAIVQSESWTDAHPMLNLSTSVTTDMEPEAVDQSRPRC
jgi:glutamate decarboxylase